MKLFYKPNCIFYHFLLFIFGQQLLFLVFFALLFLHIAFILLLFLIYLPRIFSHKLLIQLFFFPRLPFFSLQVLEESFVFYLPHLWAIAISSILRLVFFLLQLFTNGVSCQVNFLEVMILMVKHCCLLLDSFILLVVQLRLKHLVILPLHFKLLLDLQAEEFLQPH